MSIVQKLTEGIVNRDLKKEGEALLNKWSQTGLLEGLSSEHQKSTMARLLENQAKELLRESNTMSAGDVAGFASVAFPIVRRVFAGLIANDLVSVQPMSLPSGLIFFLDFTWGSAQSTRLGETAGQSIYGQGVKGSGLIDGVTLNSANLDKQPYNLGSAYSSPTGSIGPIVVAEVTASLGAIAFDSSTIVTGSNTIKTILASSDGEAVKAMLKADPDLLADTSKYLRIEKIVVPADTNLDNVTQVTMAPSAGTQVRRLTQRDKNAAPRSVILVTTHGSTLVGNNQDAAGSSYPIIDGFENVGSTALGAIQGTTTWGLEAQNNIPEIDIRVDSTAITAMTKKLKAKWTPELGQDLNAYHNLDAEVELTSILSEQIALEIDREILADLVNGATAGTYYWSRSPGLFVDKEKGTELGAASAAPDFTGTVSEWYETLIETINDVSAQIHRKTLRGGANFVVVSPEVANILEFTSGFRANVTADADKGDIGAVKVGSLSRKFDVIVDPYFPRQVVLVGRKGNSFLESGYVYAPYVPLQTTPTIFGPEDFVPRKGVMTRYAKKMVRPDMYGLVIVRGLLGEEGTV